MSCIENVEFCQAGEPKDEDFIRSEIQIPTVIGQLRKVLLQYPDNGQIIKEFVQNAEDAGATELEATLYPQRFTLSGVYHIIEKFVTGPAVCVYNNSVFREEDWVWITRLDDSMKRDDPCKVGRFGLGFKSVFHITDFVMILSGNYVLFLDPSESGKDMCRKLKLQLLTRYIPERYCLDLWKPYITSQHLKKGHIPSSIFWLPLRQNASQISNNIYTEDRVHTLFESFATDASISIMFLKSLNKITLLTSRFEHDAIIHEVRLAASDMSKIYSQRQKLFTELERRSGDSGSTEEAFYSYKIMLQSKEKNQGHKEQLLHILHYLPSSSQIPEGRWRKDQLPLVSVAAPIDPQANYEGRIFCFLPLPLHSTDHTRLPVHINGSFVLDQNRRYVHWATEDASNDLDMVWNELLVSCVLPKAYLRLLEKVHEEVEGGCYPKSTWYKLLPDITLTCGRWNTLSCNVWQTLLTWSIIWSENYKCLLPVSNVVVRKEAADDQVPEVVWESLNSLNIPLATLPGTLWDTLNELDATCLITASPKLVRDYLRGGGGSLALTLRPHILQYILQDHEYKDLEGIPLLPLQDSTWQEYSKCSVTVYLCTPAEAAALIGLENRLVSTELSSAVVKLLQDVANAGSTQLKIFDVKTIGTQLLQESIRAVQNFSPSFHVVMDWLANVWSLIQSLPLAIVSHLSIVPKSYQAAAVSLIPLTNSIIRQSETEPLTSQVVQALELLDIQVIAADHKFIRHSELYNFIFESSPHGINQSLEKAANKHWQIIQNFNLNCSANICQALCAAVDPYDIPPLTKSLLCQLSLFNLKDENDRIILDSITNCDKLCPFASMFPISFPEPLIVLRNLADVRLAQSLGATQLTEEDLCSLALMHNYRKQKQQQLIRYIFSSPVLKSSVKLCHQLRQLKFVTTPKENVFRPCELYDPIDTNVAALLGEDLTPSEMFTEYLPLLRDLGMKKVQDLSPKDLIEHVQSVSRFKLGREDQKQKEMALLKLINQHKDCLWICEQLLYTQFIFGFVDRPEDYPESLLWATSREMYMPQKLKSYSLFKYVLSSVWPLIQCDEIPNVTKAFGWDRDPNMGDFFQHLFNIKESTDIDGFVSEWHRDTCHQIYDYLDNIACKALETSDKESLHYIRNYRDHEILLTKLGFRKPNVFAISKDCSPDLFSIEAEGLWKYRSLVGALGIEDHFPLSSVLKALYQKGEKKRENYLSNDEVQQVSKLLDLLFVEMSNHDISSDFENSLKYVPLPNRDRKLHPASSLYIDDNPDVTGEGLNVVHSSLCLSEEMTARLGIKMKSLRRLKNSATRISFEVFGQREPLTARLRNILRDYPCDSGIMKELVQNADDAEASKVVFIKDRRTHSTSKLLNKKLAPLQGPALCVYNDSCFKEDDFNDIQKLGDCSKRNDPGTIGQYGIGFNIVYHFTDAPSFITKGSGIPEGETLCIFDPCCQYYPDVTEKYPGVRLHRLADLRRDHPNSFSGYLEEDLLKEKGTVFRLPLRTKSDSPISSKVLTMDDIDDITNEAQFMLDMKKSLLFLRNVREISIITITEEGDWRMECTTQSKINQSNLHAVNTIEKYLKQNMIDPYKISPISVEFDMEITVTDKDKKEEKFAWHVFHQVGAIQPNSIPLLVKKAYDTKALTLLPRGGIAVLIEGNDTSLHATSCYLPLPITSGLPFSISGHFALNTARRDLWVGMGDFKSLWNSWLMQEVLVPVAARALLYRRHQLFSSGVCSMLYKDYNIRIDKYYGILPNCNTANAEIWKKFVKYIYKYAEKHKLPLFEVCLFEEEKQLEQKKERVTLRWHPLKDKNYLFHVYFCGDGHLKLMNEKVSDILKRLGMNIGTQKMYQLLVNADIDTFTLSPDLVLRYLHFFALHSPHLFDGAHFVENTPFRSTDDVGLLFEYVARVEKLHQYLNNLPLLVTSDMILRFFSKIKPVFLTRYCHLLPKLRHEFMCSQLEQTVQDWLQKEWTKYTGRCEEKIIEDKGNAAEIKAGNEIVRELQNFTLFDFAKRLPTNMMFLQNKHKPQEFHNEANLRQQKNLPCVSLVWLKRVWEFIILDIESRHLKTRLGNSKEKKYMDWIGSRNELLNQLGCWTLYPVAKDGSIFTTTLFDARLVLPYNNSSFDKLPVTRPVDIFSIPQKKKKFIIPRELNLCASFDDPASVLDCLLYHKKDIRRELNKWETDKSKLEGGLSNILEYFGEHCSFYRQDDAKLNADKLRMLPIYVDVFGNICSISKKQIIVLIDNFDGPLDGLRKLAVSTNTVILKPACSKKLKHLYEYMDGLCIMRDELCIYENFILPSFCHLEENHHLVHLEYIRDKLSIVNLDMIKESSSAYGTVSLIKKTPFIRSLGRLCLASNFYDPRNKIFQMMKLPSLLPEDWHKDIWQDFLKLAGMVYKVTDDMFLDFARTLSKDDIEVHEKSFAFVEYLFLHFDSLKGKMSDIKNTKFILPAKNGELSEILPLYEPETGLASFDEVVIQKCERLVWSSCCLLPQYADPVKTNVQLCGTLRSLNEVERYKTFGISAAPTCQVVEHIKNFCTNVTGTRLPNPEFVEDIVEEFYKYIDNNRFIVNEGLLAGVPIVFLNDRNEFVTPDQVVMKLELEIEPYLYCGPVKFGRFFPIFLKLGASEHLTGDLCAKVLEKIYQQSGGMKMSESQEQAANLALFGLIQLKELLSDMSDSLLLYLPTRDKTLVKSTEMYVPDNAMLEVEIKEFPDIPLMTRLANLKTDVNEVVFMQYLPENLRPKFLSEILTYDLDTNGLELGSLQYFIELRSFIKSRNFHCALLRLIHHNSVTSNKVISEAQLMKNLEFLRNVEIKQANKIGVKVKVMDKNGHYKERPCFIKEYLHHGQKCTEIYIDKACVKENDYIITQLIQVYGTHLTDSRATACLAMLLSSHNNSMPIDAYLDSCQIKSFRCMQNWPSLTDIGTHIDSDSMDLIDYDFRTFKVNDIIVLKEDISEETDDFVIVRVIECLHNCNDVLQDLYKIDNGQYTSEAKAYQLYKILNHHLEPVQEVNGLEDIKKIVQEHITNFRSITDEVERSHLHRRLLHRWQKQRGPLGLKVAVQEYIKDQLRKKEPDIEKAEVWMKQARHDIEAAQEEFNRGGSNCWIIYKCHQAAEKAVKAVLYLEDRYQADIHQNGPESHSLVSPVQCLSSPHPDLTDLAKDLSKKVGLHTSARYPEAYVAPCDKYTHCDAEDILEVARRLLSTVNLSFASHSAC